MHGGGRDRSGQPSINRLEHDFRGETEAGPFFTVSSIPIQLPEGQDFAIERGDQGGVFPNRFVGADPGKRQPRLRGVCLFGDRRVAGQLAAQQDDAALTAPAE